MIDIDYYRLLSIIGLSINYVWFCPRSTDVWLRWKNNLRCKYLLFEFYHCFIVWIKFTVLSCIKICVCAQAAQTHFKKKGCNVIYIT